MAYAILNFSSPFIWLEFTGKLIYSSQGSLKKFLPGAN